jgi:predicted nucleotidyltransferase
MKRRTKYILQRVKHNISEIDPTAKVILFGSRARGDERKDSDWDILVLTGYPVDLEKERKFRNHLYDLELETGEPFSLFAYSESDWNSRQKITPFYFNVLKEGVEL